MKKEGTSISVTRKVYTEHSVEGKYKLKCIQCSVTLAHN